MKYLLILLIVATISLDAQPVYSIVDLGTIGGFTARGINDRQQIVGFGSPTGAGGPLTAFLFDDGQLTFLPTLGGNRTDAFAINDSGWVVGSSRLASGEQHPYLYRDGVMTDLGSFGGSGVAIAVNNQGQIAGSGSNSISGSPLLPFLWENGILTLIGPNPGWDGVSNVLAQGISKDGVVLIDGPQLGGAPHPYFWDNGSWTDLGFAGLSFGISDSQQVVGYRGDTTGADIGVLWENGNLQNIFYGTVAIAINRNGQIAGFSGLLYEDGTVYDLASLLDSSGAGWSNFNCYAINNLGDIVGSAVFANQRRAVWFKRRALQITAPTTGDRWTVNRSDSIRWQSSTIGFFSIDLSLDDGLTWTNINVTTSPGDTMITYQVPDSLTTSSICRIRVSDLNDSTKFAISTRFIIKGYDLTRQMPDGSLDLYDHSIHSWRYPNSAATMWPMSWWQQFDYANGEDPYTGERYPGNWPAVPFNAQSRDMPDWPLFVEAFSEDDCYWSTTLASYKGDAEEYWRSHKRDFFGSCYGFANTSLMAFQYPEQFLANNPGIPQADSVAALFLTNTIRKGINREWAKQYGKTVLDNDVVGKPKTPRDLLHELKQLFLDETRDGQAITMFNTTASGAHTLLPYRLRRDANQAKLWRVFLYDSNNPNSFNAHILIDSTANTWTDLTGNNYGSGSKKCYLEPGNSLFLNPVSFDSETGTPAGKITDPMVHIYTELSNEIEIRNPAGQSIGYRDSSDFGDLSGGTAIIPKTGVFSPPIGYYLPRENYAIDLSEFQDSMAVISVFDDSQIYRYSRSDAEFGESDHIHVGDGLQLVNPDNSFKRIELTAIARIDSMDRNLTVKALDMVANDSLDFRTPDGEGLTLANFGAVKSYLLYLSQGSSSGLDEFQSVPISLPANTTHQVSPHWNDLELPAIIYIDLGNNGTIDDSMTVGNRLVGIPDEAPLANVPAGFILENNYPNPFNPETTIRVGLPQAARVNLEIYNIVGQRVATPLRDAPLTAGWHSVKWNGRDEKGVPMVSGMYFYRLQAGSFVQTRKMLLLK